MECLLCRFRSEVSGLKDHYCNYYAIDSKDIYFLNLFKPDCLDDNKCYECFVNFQLVEKKEIICSWLIIIIKKGAQGTML